MQKNPKATPAIADTGTSLILADEAVVEAYWSQVRGAKAGLDGMTFDCDAELPDLRLAMGGEGYMAVIPGALMSYQNSGDGINRKSSWFPLPFFFFFFLNFFGFFLLFDWEGNEEIRFFFQYVFFVL